MVGFGASTTADPNSYCSFLESRFPQLTVVNRGVRGNTTAMALERFESDVLSLNPDLVIIQFGINDSTVDVWKEPPATESRVSLADYRKNLHCMVTTLKARGAAVIVMTPNAIRWAPKVLELYGKPPYDPTDPLGFTHIVARYAEAVRQLATELNVPLVDVYAMYDDPSLTQDDFRRLLPDGLHPNREAHEKSAAALIPLVQEWLRQTNRND